MVVNIGNGPNEELSKEIITFKESLGRFIPTRWLVPAEPRYEFLRRIIEGWSSAVSKSRSPRCLLISGPDRPCLIDWIRVKETRKAWLSCLAGTHPMVTVRGCPACGTDCAPFEHPFDDCIRADANRRATLKLMEE